MPGLSRAQGYFVQVQPHRVPLGIEGLGLQTRQETQGLRVALEATTRLAETVEDLFTVVSERRMAQIMGQGSGLGDVGVAAQGPGQIAGDLGDLKGVGQSVADEVVALRADDLGLGRQSPGPRSVYDAGPITFERGPFWRVDTFRWLRDDPLAVTFFVLTHAHQA